MIERVNTIHLRAVGIDLQGQPYAANDPVLLRWVHLVEVTSFLAAYQYITLKPLSSADCDRYIAEMAQIGHLLGAVELPMTMRAAEQELMEFQRDLRFESRAEQILEVIESYPVELLDAPFMALVLRAAFDVMPEWALRHMGRSRSCEIQRNVIRVMLQAAAEPIQWMLVHQGVAATARQRVHASDQIRL